MHCFHIRPLIGIFYISQKPDCVLLSWPKWRDWVLGQLEPYFTTKKTLGKAMKCSAALALVTDITNNALPSCRVIYSSQKPDIVLFPWQKWWNWVFGQLEPYITAKKTLGEAMFRGLNTCDRHNKQCTATISGHSWGSLTLPKNLT